MALNIDWSKDGQSGQLRIANMGAGIERFEFADGSVVNGVQAEYWSLGRDRLLGDGGANRMHGGNDGASGGVLMLSGLGGDDDLKGAYYLQAATATTRTGSRRAMRRG